MKTVVTVAALLVSITAVTAKPPGSTPKEPTKKPPTAASPVVEAGTDSALARWLALVPSGPDAITIPFAPLISAISGKRIVAFDPASPADAVALAKIGGALNVLLPRMNQPDSDARTASVKGGPDTVALAFETEMRLALNTKAPEADAKAGDHAFPTLAFADPATSRMYYLAVNLYPSGGNPSPDALGMRPDLVAQGITADGCCLLVAIEHNGKPGRDIAFLNWQIVDLAKVKWRFVPSFTTGGPDAHPPGAVLTDGRKGRD